MTPAVAVRVEDLVKTYGDLVAVDGVSFEVRAGEVFGVLGPNGAGKTTLLECLEGLRTPNSGRIEVLGRDVAADPARTRSAIGVQLQVAGLPATMRVGEAVRFFCAYRRLPPRFDLLERFGLDDRLDAAYGELSGGQQRRLVLALALVHDPPIVVLDEPTSGLDVPARARLHDVIRELRAAGSTVLLATHDMAEAESLCDRVLVQIGGRVAVVASPDELTTGGDGLSRISLRTAGGTFLEDPTLPPGACRRVEDPEYARWLSEDPAVTVGALLARIAEREDVLIDLRVERPSLEDRFLELTRDGGPA